MEPEVDSRLNDGRRPHPEGPAPTDDSWNIPKPANIPQPTYWPAVLAFGCLLISFGIQTSYFFSALGAVILVIALAKWIGEIHREQLQ